MATSTQMNFTNAAERDDALAYLQKRYITKVTKVTKPSWSIEIKPVETVPVETVPAPTETAPVPPPPPPAPSYLFQDQFEGADGLITNEYAYWNPNDPKAVLSPDWEMTSGSLFRKSNAAATGSVDSGIAPNPLSTNATDSGIFRLTTKRKDFGDVKVGFSFVAEAMKTGATTPAVDWDGAHCFLRYISEQQLYYASFCRRDEKVVIKKKVPGGPSNGGTYYDISTYVFKPFPLNELIRVEATVKNITEGVQIALWLNGNKVLEAVDNGTKGGAPITQPGMVGIRGDNLQFSFDNFVVGAA